MMQNYIWWYGSSSGDLGVWSITLLLLLPGPLWPGEAVLISVPSLGLINLFQNYSYSIWILDAIEQKIIRIKNSYLKLY